MVKNLPAVERSTKIRFGKNVPDSTDQAENTIVINAGDVLVEAATSNAVYLSPIRNRTDYTAPEIVLLMYDRNTKEITESGESANSLVGGATLALTVDRANVTSNTVQFKFADNNTGFVTDSNVGISNLLPQHTVSVGSNLYIDEFGSNVLVVSGNVAVLRDMIIEGNLTVNGDTTVIYTENTSIKDAIIEVGAGNTSEDTTLDLGIIMHRPDALSNVVIGYREGTSEFTIAYTESNPTDKTLIPKTDEDINVHVYGLTHVDANIYAHEDIIASGNVYVSQNVSVTEELTIAGNVYADKDLEVVGNVYVDGNVVAYKDLLVSGNVYVSQNVSVTEELTISGNVYADKDLEVVGNTYVDGNVVAYKDLLVSGNVYVAQNVSVTEELTISGNVYADKDLEVVGNVYVDGNVAAYKDLLVTGNVYTTGNIYANKNLIVAGNVITTGNTSISGVLNLTNATTALKTNPTSNVGINIGQLKNVNVESAAVEQVIVYDGTNWNNQYIDQTLIRVKNVNGGELSKGMVVCTTGHVGNDTFEVIAADASDPDRMPAIGVLYQTLAINGEGVAVSFGRADGLNSGSLDVSNFNEGETLYVSNTVPGGVSNVKPYGLTDLIQNVGILVNKSAGVGFITGIGRANDIPNAVIETSNANVNYVYVNSENNDLRKIDPMKLPTKFQTLAQVVNTGNTVANTINVTGLTTTGNVNVGGNISVTGLTDLNNKYLPMVDTNGYFVKSPVYVTNEGKYIISASEAEFLGNITLGGNTTIISSTSITISDRIFGVGANNSATGLDSGFIIEHQDVGTFANVALIHHADEHRFSLGYTQNSFTDNHILHYQHTDGTLLRIDLLGNTLVQNNLTVNENSRFSGKVGIKTGTPAYDLDVRGTSNVGALSADSVSISDTTAAADKTSGALQVAGGVGVQGDIYTTNITGSDTVKGVSVTGTNIYGVITGSNAATVTTLSASDVVNITDTTVADSTTTGALTVTGGISTQANLYVGKDTYITSNLNVNGSTLHVDTQTSNVGIGKTDPGFTLDVAGDINFSGSLYEDGTPFISTPWTINGNDLAYTTGNITVGTTLFHVDTQTSNVGIGKTDPGFTLDVTGDVNFSGELYQGGSPFISTPWTIETSPDALSYTAGNVGIGVVNPSSTLEVGGDISAYELNVANVTTGNLIMNTVTVNALQSFGSIVNVSNITSNTVQFTNSNVSIVATSNIHIGGIAKQSSVPAFTVRLTDGTIVGTGDLIYNQVDTDNTSSYTAVNGKFTAPVAGHYFFSAHGIYQNDVTIYDFTVSGTRQNINSLCSSPSANYIQCNISAVLYLNIGDYVTVYQVEGGTFGTDNNVFTGFFIG